MLLDARMIKKHDILSGKHQFQSLPDNLFLLGESFYLICYHPKENTVDEGNFVDSVLYPEF